MIWKASHYYIYVNAGWYVGISCTAIFCVSSTIESNYYSYGSGVSWKKDGATWLLSLPYLVENIILTKIDKNRI